MHWRGLKHTSVRSVQHVSAKAAGENLDVLAV